jgi:predicted NBD/HSP70 family sugar kinase
MYIVAVAMDQLVTRIAVMDIYNNQVSTVEKFELPLQQETKALSILSTKITGAIKKSGIDAKKIVGVGIGMPGFVDATKGINYSFFEAKETSITGFLSGKIGLPVFIDNDSSLVALAELRFGAARNSSNAMILNISWGVGLGMVLNGQLFRGQNGFAGEFSHIPLFTNNKLCSCGKNGCLETETSLLVIVDKAMEGLKAGRASLLKHLPEVHYEQAYDALVETLAKGDKFTVELFSAAAYNIGRGIAVLMHLLNPEKTILSGRGSSAGKIWLAPIQQALNEHCIPRLSANTEVEISTLGYNAELIGAAALVMEHYDELESTSTMQSTGSKMATA